MTFLRASLSSCCAALLAAGCVAESASDLAEDPALAGANHAGAVTFAPCEDDPELECGWLTVPVDDARPSYGQLQLATIRARATGPRRLGVLFVNPGGPGGSGIDFVTEAKPLFAPLRQHFDIVSFDPRGTGRSQMVSCLVPLPAPPSSGTLPARAAYNDELSLRIPAACGAEHGALATRIGTLYTAQDIDRLRAALGERTINYLGLSYGTALGAMYATSFPSRVRAMVLDGNVPPSWFSDNLLEIDSEGSAEAELTLRRLDQMCRADVACPLSRRGVLATFDALVARQNRTPTPVEGGVIDGQSIRATVFSALYSEALWPRIVTELVRAEAGHFDVFFPSPAEPLQELAVPPALPITCNDTRTRRAALDYLPMQELTNASYPRFGGVNFGDALVSCAAWPMAPSRPITASRTRAPIVLIGNDYDPATPMTWTRAMAATLQGQTRLVRYRGGGHTVFGSGSECIDEAMLAYYRDLTVPPLGMSCPAVPRPFGASTVRAADTRTVAEIVADITATARGAKPFGARLR